MNDKIKNLVPNKTALLVIDFQNDIASVGGKMAPSDESALARFDIAIDNAAKAVVGAKNNGVRVIYVYHTPFADNGEIACNQHSPMNRYAISVNALMPGSDGFSFVKKLAPQEGDGVVIKHTISAFVGTGLKQQLQKEGIDSVVIAGLVSHWAVEGAHRSAHDIGFRSMVLEDASASGIDKSHKGALERIKMLGEIMKVEDFLHAISA